MAVLSDDMGGITAYAAAVNRGYTGTKEEFEQLMYSYTEVAERAEAAAGNAHESEEATIEAKDIAVGAKNEAVSARDASQSARDASISAKNDSESARDAAISAKNYTLAAKDAVMSAKSSVDETSANFSDEVTAAISDVNAAGRNQKELAKTHAVDSEAWAVGQREGADVGVSDETYHNNSKYYAEQSALAKSETETARDTAITAKNDAVSAKNEAETAKGQAQDIVDGINAKSEQIDQNAEDISALQTAISTKAEIDGNYENLTAGTAEQLASTVFIEDNAPYHFRTSGGSADIGDREYDQIVGGTINWNQLAGYNATAGSTTSSGVTFTINSDGSVDVSGEASAQVPFNIGTRVDGHAGHVRFVKGCPIGGSTSSYTMKDGYGNVRDIGNGCIDKINSDYSIAQIIIASGYSITGTLKFKPQIFDLTQMFGSTIADYIYSLEQANAGDGVAWFRKYFPKDYYEYNAGELISVSGLSAHKMTGFNQWDEEWKIGELDTNTGAEISGNLLISKNYIPVLGGVSYYWKSPYGGIRCFYDSDKNFISAVYPTANTAFTTPSNACYMKFREPSNYGTTYNHDICINLHWDGERDGEYEPYEEHSYSLDSDVTLRGIPKLDANNNLYYDGDEYESDGKVTRKYGVVDLGTLNYNYYAPSTFFYTNITGRASNTNCVCALYTNVWSTGDSAMAAVPDMSMAPMASANGQIKFKNSAYTTTGDFKTAMSGVMLVYELATPTTEQAQSFTNPQIVDDFGTEEYVTESIVPVGHVTKYANNLRAKLEMAPNSPDGDGDYIVRQTNGLNEYVSLSSSEVIQNINEDISDNASDINELKEDLTNLQSIVWTEGYISGAGTISTGAGRYYSNLLICPPNTSVSYVAETNHSNILGISFYDASGTFISGVANNGAIGTEMTVTSPNSCAFCRLSTNTAYKDKSYYKIATQGIEYIVKSLAPLNDKKYLSFVTNGTTRSLTNTDVENILTATVVNSDYLIALFYNDGGVSRNTGWVTSVNTLAVSGTLVSWQLKRVDNAVMPSGILADVVEVVRASDLVTQKDMANTGFVSKSGSDSNSGVTRANALLTISAAINKGYKNIIIGEGTYAESLTLTGINGLYISLDMSHNNYSATDNPDNPKVVIDGGNSNTNGIVMTDCYDCTFEGIEVCNFTKYAWTIDNCSGITFIDCVAHDIAIGQQSGGGFVLTDTNADFYNCVAYNLGTTVKGTNTYHIDGFNIHNTGTVNLFNCSAWNCEDDGASHHDACCGVIDGGEWHDCGKGGVSSPTHGAKVDVRNVYCYDNNYAGIYADSDHVFEDRGKTIFSNCVCKNNRYDMVVGDEYSVIAINCVYDTVSGSANITRFGITD